MAEKDGIILVEVDAVAKNIGRSPAIRVMTSAKILTLDVSFNIVGGANDFFDVEKRWASEIYFGANILPNGEKRFGIASNSDPEFKIKNGINLRETFLFVCATYVGVNAAIHYPAQTGVIFQLEETIDSIGKRYSGRLINPIFVEATSSIFPGRTV